MTASLFAIEELEASLRNTSDIEAHVHFKRSKISDGAARIELPPNERPCFRAGTRIATPEGGSAIEDLRAGDLVRTRNGVTRSVRRITRREIDLASHPAPERVQPIHIRARAFANQTPIRDLCVSPNLGVWCEGRLVPASFLVNGSSIVRDTQCRSVTYFHIVLDAHGTLLAEGLPTEGYVDADDRAAANMAATSLQQIADQAAAPRVAAEAPDLHIVTDGRRRAPLNIRNGRYRFVIPHAHGALRIQTSGKVAIRDIVFHQDMDVVPIPMDHPMLTEGWSAWERDDRSIWRWTDGDAVLATPIMGNTILEIECR